jgi:hypothetical protein
MLVVDRAAGCLLAVRLRSLMMRMRPAAGRSTTCSSTKTPVPTLLEVKRSSDTRIRREVVGQMLDYAANGVVK